MDAINNLKLLIRMLMEAVLLFGAFWKLTNQLLEQVDKIVCTKRETFSCK